MKRVNLSVDVITISEAKLGYIRTKDVDEADVNEVLLNAPAYFLFNSEWGIYDMIGPNLAGRILYVGIQNVQADEWRLVTAFWNDDGRGRRFYGG